MVIDHDQQYDLHHDCDHDQGHCTQYDCGHDHDQDPNSSLIKFLSAYYGVHWESLRYAQRPTQDGCLPNSTPLVSLQFLGSP